MKVPLILVAILAVAGCSTRASLDKHLNQAYRAYEQGDCAQVMLQLSLADRASRSRAYMQPEISMLRGQCLERQGLFLDAAQTYQYIIKSFPASEYAYRARARLETLRKLGHYHPEKPVQAMR